MSTKKDPTEPPSHIYFKSDFEKYTPYVPDLPKKQTVTAQSLEKIEDGEFLSSQTKISLLNY
jgi:hypothetical protein